MATAKSKGKELPGFSVGVRENASVRMVKLARPICPNSQVEMMTTPEGRLVPRRDGGDPNRQNCQKEEGRWWERCEERGHNPYFTAKTWYESVEELDPETQVVTTKKRKHHGNPCEACGGSHLYPNVAQVAANTRINGGQGPRYKIERHGFKRLSDIGYEEVCQYRNCQKPLTVTSRMGQYCGKLHAALVAADVNEELLQQLTGRFETGPDEAKLVRRRQKQLIEAAEFAEVRPIK